MKKIIMILTTVILISMTMRIVLGSEVTSPYDKYQIYKERFDISEERFLEDVKIKNIGTVMSAANIANCFDKNIDEIYLILSENNNNLDKVGELLRNESHRTTSLYLPSKPEEIEVEQITERLENVKQLSDPRGNFIDNSRVIDTSSENAIKTYNEAMFLYAFDEDALNALLVLRPAGEVLLAGNLAHNFEMTVEYVLNNFDKYKSDYHSAYNQLYDEWISYEQEYNN